MRSIKVPMEGNPAMEDDPDFRRATRRLLFEPVLHEVQNIPGAGKSAAEVAEKHTRVKVTINLDGDVIAHFKEQARAEGRAYQSLVNQVLREHVEGSRPERIAAEVRRMLLEDRSFLQALRKSLAEFEKK